MRENHDVLAMSFGACLRQLRRMASHNETFQTLSNGEFFLLHTVAKLEKTAAESGHVRVSGLSRELTLSPQAISKMLRALEGKGYVRRVTDPDDRRNTFVLITGDGNDLLAAAEKNYIRFSQAVIDRMGRAEMEEFIRLSQKCYRVIEDVSAEFYQKKEEIS